jgi:hypothetical protein
MSSVADSKKAKWQLSEKNVSSVLGLTVMSNKKN